MALIPAAPLIVTTGESAHVPGWLVLMVRSLTTMLATPIVIVAGASKPSLRVIAPTINIMASGACATPPKKLIVATTTKATGVTAMPCATLSMLVVIVA